MRARVHVHESQDGVFSVVSRQHHQDVFVREGIWERVPQTNERGKREKEGERLGQSVLNPYTVNHDLCVCVCHWALGQFQTVRGLLVSH